MEEIEEYRYVYAKDIIATGDPSLPIIHCIDGIINPIWPSDPKFSPLHDYKTEEILYVQDLISGFNYNPGKRLKELLNKL